MPATTDAPPVRVRLLGNPGWQGPRHHPVALPRKDAALFALLALGEEPGRDRVAAWLWPEAPLANARLNLRQRLHKLRAVSGHRLVQAGEVLRPLPGLQFDLSDPADAAPALPASPLLGTLDFHDLPAFDRWLRTQRRRQVEREVDRLAAHAAQAESEGSLARAIELAQRAVAAAPWLEHAWRRLMRLHHRRGDRAAAVATFERFEREVCTEQGLRPAAETLELLRTVERADPAPAGPQPLPAQLLRPPRLVGRDAALAALRGAWAEGRAVLVSGPGGIGKTRLLDDALQAQGAGGLRARARPGDAAVPYATASAWLRQLLDRYAPVLDAAPRAELARLLPALGPAATHAVREPELWQAVDHLLRRAQANGLTAVVVDDLHHADAASLDLMRWLLPEPQPGVLAWAFGTRLDEAGEQGARLQAWAGESTRLQPLPLVPLDLASLRELLASLDLALPPSLTAATTDGLAEALYRHAGGHPFFTLETLKALLHGGAPGAALPQPLAATALLQRRLRALSVPAQQVLALAAVAGEGWSLDVAAQALQQSVADLLPAWRELEQAQVFGAAGFQHDLVRAAALALLPQGARPALHAQLAQALQAARTASPATLADHWAQAGHAPRAAAAWLQAADAARRTGRLTEQVHALQQAAAAHQRAGDEAAAFDAACAAAQVIGVKQGDAAALAALDELAPRARQPAQQARVQVQRAEALLNQSRLAEALHAAQSAQALAPAGSPEAADTGALLGRALALTGRVRDGVALLRRAHAQAARAGDARRERDAGAALAHAQLAADERTAALRTLQRVVDLARAEGDRAELAPHLANLATLALMTGNPERALPWALQAHALLQALQADGAQAHYNAVMAARAAAALGDLALALDLLQPACAAEAGPTIATMARISLAGVLAALGRSDEALDRLPPLRDDVSPLAAAGLLLARARLLHVAGQDPGEPVARLLALDRAQPALFDEPTLCSEFGRWPPAAEAAARLARVHATWQRRAGCEGLARGLAVRWLHRLLDTDPAAAAALATTLQRPLQRGVHAGIYRPEAWWLLSQALRPQAPVAADQCLQAARDWLAAARLPADDAQARHRFEQGNPLNRRVLAAAR